MWEIFIGNRKTVQFVFLFLAFHGLFAQNFNSNIVETSFEAGPQKVSGYQTSFDFPVKDVRYGFWKYSKRFGRPVNKRTYYEVEIPSFINQGNVDVLLFGKTTGTEKESTFYLAVDSEGIPADVSAKYQKQTKKLLLDFKKNFYFEHYQDQIEEYEKQLRKLGKKYMRLARKGNKTDEKRQLLEEISTLEKQTSNLREKQLDLR